MQKLKALWTKRMAPSDSETPFGRGHQMWGQLCWQVVSWGLGFSNVMVGLLILFTKTEHTTELKSVSVSYTSIYSTFLM